MVVNFTPTTSLKLMTDIPLDNTYNNVMSFTSLAQQGVWREAHTKYTCQNMTYQRERRAVRVPYSYDEVIDVNYVAYLNENFTNKWFYAFVIEVNYVNPNMAELVIEQDVFTTWYFDFEIKPSFIERETVDDDSLFKHTVPESLETGPHIVKISGTYNITDMSISIAYAPNSVDNSKGYMRDGVYTGVKYVWYPATNDGVLELNNLIESFAEVGELSSILSIFMVPNVCLVGGKHTIEIKNSFNQMDGYTVKNKKLFCYPFNYLSINNQNGFEVPFRFELFRNPSDFIFNVSTAYNLESAVNMHPMDYDGVDENWDECVILSDFPQCTWQGNIYAQWVNRNKNQLDASLFSSVIGLGTSLIGAIANPGVGTIGGLASNVGSIFSSLATIQDKADYPYAIQQQGSTNISNVKWQRVGFTIKRYSLQAEYAKIIDDYFSMYGYKVNRRGVPNLNSRTSWNYLKTLGSTVTGPFPVAHKNKLQNIFDHGVTIWHTEDVGNYNLNNAIVNAPAPPVWPDPTEPPDPEPEPPIPSENWTYPFAGWQDHVTSEWGYRTNPITGILQFHNGMDIACSLNTQLRAIHEGVVIFIGSNSQRGNYMRVQVSSNTTYLYQHLNNHTVNVNETVEAGQIIALSGSTGASTGPHLHVEIEIDGKTVNPRTYIPESPSVG